MVDACQQLAALFAEHPDRRATFLAQDGIVAIIELLEERSHKVLLLIARAGRCRRDQSLIARIRSISNVRSHT